jgi:hypothetical protein
LTVPPEISVAKLLLAWFSCYCQMVQPLAANCHLTSCGSPSSKIKVVVNDQTE